MTKLRYKLLFAFSLFSGTILLSFFIYFAYDILGPVNQYLYNGTRFGVSETLAIGIPAVFAGLAAGYYVKRFSEGIKYIIFTWGIHILSLLFIKYKQSVFSEQSYSGDYLELFGFFLISAVIYSVVLCLTLYIKKRIKSLKSKNRTR